MNDSVSGPDGAILSSSVHSGYDFGALVIRETWKLPSENLMDFFSVLNNLSKEFCLRHSQVEVAAQ
jgi:hypothetical protein